MRILAAGLIALLAIAGCGKEVTPPPGPLVCAGSERLCERRYDEVSFATAHNAMSSEEEGFAGPNQKFKLSRQLAQGIRGFMLDVYSFEGKLYLCHVFCELGKRPLVEALNELRVFLELNPGELLTLQLESYVTGAEIAADFEAAKLTPFAVVQPKDTPWPTLGELVKANKRLVVFAEKGGGSPDWYMELYAYSWETNYHFEKKSQFSCTINRGDKKNALFTLNHFLTAPVASPELAAQVNPNPCLIDRARQCQAESGRLPNFVAVDFTSVGDVVGVVKALNGL